VSRDTVVVPARTAVPDADEAQALVGVSARRWAPAGRRIELRASWRRMAVRMKSVRLA
jgi:hypothetical protein